MKSKPKSKVKKDKKMEDAVKALKGATEKPGGAMSRCNYDD